MYSFSLSRFSFFTKTKRHIKTFPAVVIPYTVFFRQPSPLPPTATCFIPGRLLPDMLRGSPTRVGF